MNVLGTQGQKTSEISIVSRTHPLNTLNASFENQVVESVFIVSINFNPLKPATNQSSRLRKKLNVPFRVPNLLHQLAGKGYSRFGLH
jgi:hypothetical protein